MFFRFDPFWWEIRFAYGEGGTFASKLCPATPLSSCYLSSQQVVEHSRPELPLVCEPFLPQYRSSIEEDTASLSGESLDGHPQATGSCPRLTPPPNTTPDTLLSLPPHGLWSRHILQQTLMDEGLRLARLVSHERVGRVSPCLPGKAQLPEFGENLSERCQPPAAQPDVRRNSVKVEPETSRQ
uniref:Uncharacterized protein n=1 Tax=Varanus komodoensis TaxID=61221 RepID=A0A8D2LAX4_VARKO